MVCLTLSNRCLSFFLLSAVSVPTSARDIWPRCGVAQNFAAVWRWADGSQVARGTDLGGMWGGSQRVKKNSEPRVAQPHLGEAIVVVEAYLTAVHEVSEPDASVAVQLLILRAVVESKSFEVFWLPAFCKLLV